MAEEEEAQTRTRGQRQVRMGVVLSDKMNKTVIVGVENTKVHRLYQRYMKRTSKFVAHDESNESRVGDKVILVSSRPLSKSKRWRVREIVGQADQA